MIFERAWVLLLLPLPLAWMVLAWRSTGRRLGLALRAASLALIVAALAEPRLSIDETKVAVALLVDTSASVPEADLERASAIAASAERERGRNWLQVIPFARETRSLTSEEASDGRLRPSPGEAGRSTDLEAALRDAAAALPAGMIPRIVLVSDGKENLGSATRAAWQQRQIGIPVDTYALAGRLRPELRLEAVHLPATVFSGERFEIGLSIVSPRAMAARVLLAAEGKPLGESGITLEKGPNLVRLKTSIGTAGAVEVTGEVRAEDGSRLPFARAVSLRRPRVLYVSQDPEGTGTHLLGALAAARFEVKRVESLNGETLDDFQIITLNNQDLESIAPARKADLESFVQQGGGLLVIGGERNVYVDTKKVDDALDRALPAKLAPPRSPEGTCVVLVLDKSSSMEGKKMGLALIAAIGVVDNLRPSDLVGVLTFDNTFQWTVPIRRAEDRTLIRRLIAGTLADGGTQIAPALAEAFRSIVPVQATYKHIVLLTDGISEEGTSMDVAAEAARRKVTISTVGLGLDVNRAYLEKIAASAQGKSYFLADPSELEQILLRDVMEHTGSTAVERILAPAVLKNAEILDGVGMESAPALRGYVRFTAKPTAETILGMENDPLLTRWQYGLGRSAVFASDAKSRWAAEWVNWRGYDRFWANVLHDLLPHAEPGEARLDYDNASGDLVATYKLSPHVQEPVKAPDIYALGPGGFRQALEMDKVAPGTYRGTVRIGNRKGLFRVRPLEESRAFPETGYYRQEEELDDYGSEAGLLQQIAQFTGGRSEPPAGRVFDAGGRRIASSLSLWPGLLALAALASLGEIVNRKWKGILELVSGPRGSGIETAEN